ncbi:hypothetical protein LTR64_004763 [Lithohypha guttulata]|uniref:Protein phosphatase inhibitor 2 n=1 Tax=Lithohypha guttulata TaxID=1690604 RepID=A0AAN7T4P9_9EURO|nr:hypothetical protein LTR51_005940 [Lithohypha guttulata]KAK5088144.1 hypothetical protein LTR05_002361 [Lithohypha guttulata]
MPVEESQPPPIHEPNHSNVRPKGILKNPSFSGPGDQSPTKEVAPTPPSVPLDPQEAKDLTIQNTLQNAGHRRSSSAARRSSTSRRHSSAAGLSGGDSESDAHRLKWDEANLYLAEQEAGGRMKITEPKTPFEYGNNAMQEDEEEEDVSIDPRYVNVDEVEMAKNKPGKKPRESDIPDMSLGEPEDETAGASMDTDRIVRQGSLSREASKEKHVNVADGGLPGMPTTEEEEQHREFEERRKKHYEMRNVKDMLGHPENLDDDDDENPTGVPALPSRGVNGGP